MLTRSWVAALSFIVITIRFIETVSLMLMIGALFVSTGGAATTVSFGAATSTFFSGALLQEELKRQEKMRRNAPVKKAFVSFIK